MPSFNGFNSTNPWVTRVQQERDEAGNTTEITRRIGQVDTVLMTAEFRNAGRPERRTVSTYCGASCAPASVARQYGYEGSGRMSSMSVSARGSVVAGSSVGFDGIQVQQAQLLGLSAGARANEYLYDQRSRLSGARFAREQGTSAIEVLTPADFREALIRPPGQPSDPPSLLMKESKGHKIAELVRGAETRTFVYNGAERIDDGRFRYEFDARGRLSSVTEKIGSPFPASIRRILYVYGGSNRIVGRRAEYAPVSSSGTPPLPSDWRIEDRPSVFDADGLPAETTFVWDSISDQLVAVFKAGASENPNVDAHNGLVRQIIHGGLGYDDPLEMAIADSGVVRRLYPIYDEAAAGSLQAVISENGEIASRTLLEGAYGEDEFTIAGPAIDKIEMKATKDSNGALESIEVRVRSTEELTGSTVSAGTRLAAVNTSGAVLRMSTATPTLTDGFTITWTLTPVEWTALASTPNATALSIAVTDQLRARAWSPATTVLPPLDWIVTSKPVFTSPSLPLEYRESLTSLSAWLTSIGTGTDRTTTLYHVESLTAVASPSLAATAPARPERLLVSAPFHALPFAEPMTGMEYARDRWLDPRTGSFLTPDVAGYADTSNPYSFCAGDPVNRRDPTGEITIIVHGTSAKDAPWWNTGSFSRSLDAEAGDVWKIATAGGKPVSKVGDLTRRFGPSGKFSWSGGNSPRDRMEGAQRLADYINTIRTLYPREPIRVVTHSHGGNVATASTNDDLLSSPATIDQLVVIAKPYFSAQPTVFKTLRDRQTFYDPDVTHIGSRILSISSLEDDIQKAAAERGAFDRTGLGYGPVQSTRRILARGLASHFVDVEVKTDVGWYDAHGVLHGSVMGTAIGIYLRNGGNSAADWARARALGGVPKVITNDKDKGD